MSVVASSVPAGDPLTTEPPIRRRRWPIVLTIGLFAVLALLWTMGVVGGNVREVDPGRLYRSAQLTDGNLETTMRRFGIRSVVNLRGAQPKADFYRSEMRVCHELGAAHRDISLSAYSIPNPKELSKLMTALDSMPRPILVHCRGGADRTGLVATIYETVYEGRPLDEAERDQLTWRYGHLAFSRSRAMDRFFDLYRETGRGQSLREWMTRTYPAVYARVSPRRSGAGQMDRE